MMDRVEYYGCVVGLFVVALMGGVLASFGPWFLSVLLGFVLALAFFLSYRLGTIFERDSAEHRQKVAVRFVTEAWQGQVRSYLDTIRQLSRAAQQWEMRLKVGRNLTYARAARNVLNAIEKIISASPNNDRVLLPDWFFEV